MRIPEATPAIERVLHEFQQYRLNESGAVISSTDHVTLAEEPSEPPLADGDGVLIISARPQLAPGMALRTLAQQLGPRSIALFGTRSWRSDEHAFVSAKRIQVYDLIEISREGLAEVTDAVMTYCRSWQRFHVVLDLDVLDAAFAPGLRHPVPGGLSGRELIYVLQRLRLIKSMGSVQVICDTDPENATCRLAAHLLAELS